MIKFNCHTKYQIVMQPCQFFFLSFSRVWNKSSCGEGEVEELRWCSVAVKNPWGTKIMAYSPSQLWRNSEAVNTRSQPLVLHPSHCKAASKTVWISFFYFLNAKKEVCGGVNFKKNVCFLKIFSSSSWAMKHPQFSGMEIVSTCNYYYIAYYIGRNPSTPCNNLDGPCTPLSTPRLFLLAVPWPLRTCSLCQGRSSTTGKAAWLWTLFLEPETPKFLLPCSRTPTVPRQNTSGKYFGLQTN